MGNLFVSGFSLVDMSTGTAAFSNFNPVDPSNLLTPTDIFLTNFSTCELNIEAITSCFFCTTKCVNLKLGNYAHKETTHPYALYGNTNSTFFYDKTPPLGEQTLTACAYTDNQCTQSESCLSYVVNVRGGGAITSFEFIYPSSTSTIQSGSTNCLPKGQKVNIHAVGDSCVDKVNLKLTNGTKTVSSKTEYNAPFTLYPNDGGKSDFQLKTDYTITATPNGDTTKTTSSKFQFVKCTDPDVLAA